ncbi:hypothetical protein ACFXKH_38155 [Streptomyces caelestis]|uniref:hypothetical protein n=1 Tax=Streptomyces caelestis TaxID=36816 RepID=UPI00368772B2
MRHVAGNGRTPPTAGPPREEHHASHHLIAVLILLTLTGLGIGRLAYKNPALGTSMVTATTVLALLSTVLQAETA